MEYKPGDAIELHVHHGLEAAYVRGENDGMIRVRPELQRLAALNGAHCAPDDLISVFLHGW